MFLMLAAALAPAVAPSAVPQWPCRQVSKSLSVINYDCKQANQFAVTAHDRSNTQLRPFGSAHGNCICDDMVSDPLFRVHG